jgi:peptidoglycan/xylan/chitin deacetylase (PgdA/CDA1 family)
MRERTMCFLFFLFAMIALSSCGADNRQTASGTFEPSGTPALASSSPNLLNAPAPNQEGAAAPKQDLTSTPEPTPSPVSSPAFSPKEKNSSSSSIIKSLIDRYSTATPKKWGEHVPGVRTHLVTKEKVIALTFDACGGKEGSGYDKELIDYLVKEHIPATLFVNARWIAANPDTFTQLAENSLFEIENHGTEHRPLSVTGRLAYGIAGTKNVNEVIHEVTDNADRIEKLTGRRPLFFRSGTAYYDDVAAGIVHDLGFQLAGYNVLGDAGATYNTEQVYNALISARSGSIVLAHMNHPEKDTAEGVMKAIPDLQKAGFRFVQLSSYALE